MYKVSDVNSVIVSAGGDTLGHRSRSSRDGGRAHSKHVSSCHHVIMSTLFVGSNSLTQHNNIVLIKLDMYEEKLIVAWSYI